MQRLALVGDRNSLVDVPVGAAAHRPYTQPAVHSWKEQSQIAILLLPSVSPFPLLVASSLRNIFGKTWHVLGVDLRGAAFEGIRKRKEAQLTKRYRGWACPFPDSLDMLP